MQSQNSSRNPSHLTDEFDEIYVNMTGTFLQMFFSGRDVCAVSYIRDDVAFSWTDDSNYLVSHKTKSDYLKWVEALPPLLKELR
jgi:hypothetical protein